MAEKGPRILIAQALEDLSKEDFPRFVTQMGEKRADNLNPKRFRRAQVTDKTFQQLADLIVDAFSDQAVSVTLGLFRAIDANKAADDLEADYAEQQPAPRNQNSGQASGAKAQKRHFVDRHRSDLIDRVSNVSRILDHLLQEGVITQEPYDKAMKIAITQDQMRFLFSGPLTAGGDRSKDVLVSALKEHEAYLFDDLMRAEN